MTLTTRRAFAGCLFVFAAALAGCGGGRVKVYPVEGSVTYNGEPLAGVDVAFHPADAKNDTSYPPHATTDESGKFKLMTFTKDDGAPAGEFKVAVAFAVQSAEDGADQIKKMAFQVPEKYHRKETTPLKATIKPESNTLPPLPLEGPPLAKRKR